MSDNVRLVNHMIIPGDIAIVSSARQSYGKSKIHYVDEDVREYEPLTPRDIGVLEFMMEHRHGTPFEAEVMSFQIRCTIKEARDWFRYRFSSYNEYSTRFSPRIKESYVLPASAMRRDVVDPITKRKRVEHMNVVDDWSLINSIQTEMEVANADANRHYENLLGLGLAQEAASYVYNLAQITEFTWTVNARSLLNFLSQRMDGAALYELRRKAYEVYALAEPRMPETMKLWSKYQQPDMMTDWNDEPPVEIPEGLQ